MSVFDHPLSLLALSAVKTRSSQDVGGDEDSYSSDSSATDTLLDTPVERHTSAAKSLYVQTLQFNFHRSLLVANQPEDTRPVTGVKRSISELDSESSTLTDEELDLAASPDHIRKKHKSVDK
jgi:hypothetical protein